MLGNFEVDGLLNTKDNLKAAVAKLFLMEGSTLGLYSEGCKKRSYSDFTTGPSNSSMY